VKVSALLASVVAMLASGCEPASNTSTFVVLDNAYAARSQYVIYQAFWQAVPFETPIPPGTSSDAQSTVPASGSTAYVLVAPGWDPASSTPPTSFVVLESRQAYGVHVGDTVHIPVSDTSFVGNCAAGNPLPQSEATFITQLVFPDIFSSYAYDAATCTATPLGDAGAG
jgi:hypothetical protein